MSDDRDEGQDRIDRRDSASWRALQAIQRGADKDGHMDCPTCREKMDVIRRGRRLTFAGWEPACVQYDCATCGFGGEYVSPENHAEWERLGKYGTAEELAAMGDQLRRRFNIT